MMPFPQLKNFKALCLTHTLAAFLVFLLSSPSNAQTVYHVNINSSATNPDGESWETAYRSIQAAIDAANDGAAKDYPIEVWVAEGTL